MCSIMPELLPQTAGYIPQDPIGVHREVLLSYRLLFAQCSRSRKLMKQYLQQVRRDNGRVDPFLVTLCTSPLSSLWNRSSLPRDVFPF
jgi:hypothetical protein